MLGPDGCAWTPFICAELYAGPGGGSRATVFPACGLLIMMGALVSLSARPANLSKVATASLRPSS